MNYLWISEQATNFVALPIILGNRFEGWRCPMSFGIFQDTIHDSRVRSKSDQVWIRKKVWRTSKLKDASQRRRRASGSCLPELFWPYRSLPPPQVKQSWSVHIAGVLWPAVLSGMLRKVTCRPGLLRQGPRGFSRGNHPFSMDNPNIIIVWGLYIYIYIHTIYM